MSTLYNLTTEYEILLNMLYDPDIDDEVIFDTIEGVEAEIEDKADNYAKLSKILQADIDGIKAECERLTKRMQAIKARKKRLLDSLEKAMKFTGKTKFRTQLFSFAIQKNGGKQALLIDTEDVYQIPAEYLVPQDPLPDMDKIRKLLDSGATVDWAHLAPRGESLRIR